MHLLRYPPCLVHEETAPHHIQLLIRQATALEILHTPSAGASLAIENLNLLNIPIEVPEPPPIVRRKARSIEKTHQTSSSEHISGSPPTEGLRQQPSFPELIARGLLDRGESLGINKTVMNAVSELKVRLITWRF
jgi:TBC1 domain family protein 5